MSEKRFWYNTVGYGVFTLVGEVYRIGRIEVHDNECGPYPIYESTYWVPHENARAFEDFWDKLQTDFPILLSEIGSVEECKELAAQHLNITPEELSDREFVKKYYAEKYKQQR